MTLPPPLGDLVPYPSRGGGFVPGRPDLGHAAEGWDLADPAFFGDAATLLPPAAYRALAFADLEDAAVWTRSWLCVGFDAEIPGSGDLLPFTAGHHGIHVQREPDGTLVGRFNKAQHGGCRTVPLQCQTGTKTRCSFTACGYSRDGDPLPAGGDGVPTPAMHQYLGLRPERLLSVRVRTRDSLILANLEPAAAEPQHVPIPSAYLLRRPDGTASHRVEVAANWKLVLAALGRLDRIESTARPDMLLGGGHRSDGTPLRVSALFPNLLLLSDADAVGTPGGCAVILQPTALDGTLLRIAVFGAVSDRARWLAEIEARVSPALSMQGAVSRAERPAAEAASVWLQAELAARILSRPEAGSTLPLYSAGHGLRR